MHPDETRSKANAPKGGPYNRSIAPIPCVDLPFYHPHGHKPGSRWCGLEGTVTDMLAHGVTPAQITSGITLSPCCAQPCCGRTPCHHATQTMTQDGWTQPVLRDMLEFLLRQNVSNVVSRHAIALPSGLRSASSDDGGGIVAGTWQVIWTDGAMSPKPYPLGNANLSTCEWFVPELARWASRLKLDDDHAPTLPAGPHPRLILTEQDITRINRQSTQDPDAKLARARRSLLSPLQ